MIIHFHDILDRGVAEKDPEILCYKRRYSVWYFDCDRAFFETGVKIKDSSLLRYMNALFYDKT